MQVGIGVILLLGGAVERHALVMGFTELVSDLVGSAYPIVDILRQLDLFVWKDRVLLNTGLSLGSAVLEFLVLVS